MTGRVRDQRWLEAQGTRLESRPDTDGQMS
jgi:hypothetical protein